MRRLACGTLLLAALGCRQDMHDQPKVKPLAQSDFYADQRTARPAVAGTIARGQLRDDSPFFTGKVDGKFVDTLPVPLTAALLDRGRERYTIYCTPCHGQTGRGDGMVVRRGYRRPSSFHVDRLRGERVGYYYDVISNGFGAMPDYAAQIAVKDRWAVAAYVRALQLSQYANAAELDRETRQQITATETPAQPPAAHK